MTDYSKYETTPAIPEASSMIETFRAIGYSIEAAIADIIDNSISAGAKNIWINFDWKGSETWFSIKDDGNGMNNDELIQAMRPGSKNPLDDRNSNDLGRFGLGLKTASFSQCRKLSVISRKKGQKHAYWTWDLDFVSQTKNWNLLKYLPNEKKFEKEINELISGTIVLWNDIDRLVKKSQPEDNKTFDKFLHIMESVKKHLAMVFHRFIESGKIKIYFQERLIAAWNPFLTNELATQSFPEEPLQNGKVIVKGFVLPHKSKISESTFKEAEGPKGWNAQQGFYIYRNERLLLAGDWLGLFRKEEHYKLARIKIDLPNNLDTDWQIDIKKSIARPPIVLKDQLKAYAGQVRAQAVEVYRHKGRIIQRTLNHSYQPVWLEKVKHGKRFYEINRDHPMIKDAHSNGSKLINQIFRILEESLPVPLIVLKESENPDSFKRPFEDGNSKELIDLMKFVYKNLLNKNSEKQAKEKLIFMEPFNEFPELIENL